MMKSAFDGPAARADHSDPVQVLAMAGHGMLETLAASRFSIPIFPAVAATANAVREGAETWA